jgi:hypothetical protein
MLHQEPATRECADDGTPRVGTGSPRCGQGQVAGWAQAGSGAETPPRRARDRSREGIAHECPIKTAGHTLSASPGPFLRAAGGWVPPRRYVPSWAGIDTQNATVCVTLALFATAISIGGRCFLTGCQR